MAITNLQLVAYVKAQVGHPYWYGTFGQTASATLYKQKKAQYPNYYDQNKYKVVFKDQYGQRVHDCVGLIKGAVWSNGNPSAEPKYNSKQDTNANGLIKKCIESGDIGSIPEIQGLIVWKENHVGVYIGGGLVVEAKGHDSGVVITRVTERPWVKWGKLPAEFVVYAAPVPDPVPEPVIQPSPAPIPAPAPSTPTFTPYQVKVTAQGLYIRNGAGTQNKINGVITDKGIYTIVGEATDGRGQVWGKLKSGVGWISLKYTKRV